MKTRCSCRPIIPINAGQVEGRRTRRFAVLQDQAKPQILINEGAGSPTMQRQDLLAERWMGAARGRNGSRRARGGERQNQYQ